MVIFFMIKCLYTLFILSVHTLKHIQYTKFGDIMAKTKKKIAVFFGGRSPEHDVSIVSGLQLLHAIDQTEYDAFPVYISGKGEWYIGDVLRERANFLPDKNTYAQTRRVTLDVNVSGRGRLIETGAKLIGSPKVTEFDVALPVFHGLNGEDGNLQGLLEFINIPYAGMRAMASSILMDKVATKRFLKALDINCLPYTVLERPADGSYQIALDDIETAMADISYPACIKPAHLGSSIGVAKVESAEDIQACLPAIFQYDDTAIVEPFVKNLVEYNVAVSALRGSVELSALERPKAADELLDFKQKYLSGGDNKSGNKIPGDISEGMLSLTRELHPEISEDIETFIKDSAVKMFEGLQGSGAPRIDFISDGKTGEVWLNEVNPIPGSYGYFLWEAASDPILFTQFTSLLIEEAMRLHKTKHMAADPVPMDARLFKRHT